MSSAIAKYSHLPEQVAAIANLTPQPEETGWSSDLRDELSKWSHEMLTYCMGVALRANDLGGNGGKTIIKVASMTPDPSQFLMNM